MGDSITEGTIVDLPVAPGDYVEADDVVVVLETDKVSVDVRTQEAGALLEIFGEVDDVVEVGSDLFRIDTDAKDNKPKDDAESKTAPPPSPTESSSVSKPSPEPSSQPPSVEAPVVAVKTPPVTPPVTPPPTSPTFPSAIAFLG